MNTTLDIKSFPSPSDSISPKSAQEDTLFNFLVPKVEIYYRSKAFVSQININPLIAACAPLFFLIEKIQTLYKAPNIDKLHDDLLHEINAFEHQAQTQGYRSYIILAVRYVMCLWIDQIILSKPWGENSQWEKIQLTNNQGFEQDNSFYLLINRCLQEPAVYIDLLELFYLCLSLGFQGGTDFPSEANNFRITETRNCLFETITKQREGFSKRLEVETTVQSTQKRFSSRLWLRFGTIILMLFFLIGSYLILNADLEAPMSNHSIHEPLSS